VTPDAVTQGSVLSIPGWYWAGEWCLAQPPLYCSGIKASLGTTI
jgi:hypothetical protein